MSHPGEEDGEQRKKTCYFERVEEDPAEENPIFRPTDLPHFQNGADTLAEVRLVFRAM